MLWPTNEAGEGLSTDVFNMRVVDTDYTYYSINYWCDDYSGYPRVWVFTRYPDITQDWVDYITYRVTQVLPNLDQS